MVRLGIGLCAARKFQKNLFEYYTFGYCYLNKSPHVKRFRPSTKNCSPSHRNRRSPSPRNAFHFLVFVDLADRWSNNECGPVGFQHKSRDVTAACSAVGFSLCLLTLRPEGPEWDLELDSGRWACLLSE